MDINGSFTKEMMEIQDGNIITGPLGSQTAVDSHLGLHNHGVLLRQTTVDAELLKGNGLSKD